VNVFGTVALTEAILPLLSKGGAILNISSGLGSIASYAKNPARPVFPAYASTKCALNGLTAMWALQEQQKGSDIRVVAIDPGTPLCSHVILLTSKKVTMPRN
jgi:NAD(P)-dependent dehydrogenase (short-subunit alcohol dehydrogenase family)